MERLLLTAEEVAEVLHIGRTRVYHDLRHTAVSLLLALGVPPRVVREIAGHSDVKVTMTVYAHGRLDEKAAALAQLSTAVAGTLPSTVAVNPFDEPDEERPTTP